MPAHQVLLVDPSLATLTQDDGRFVRHSEAGESLPLRHFDPLVTGTSMLLKNKSWLPVTKRHQRVKVTLFRHVSPGEDSGKGVCGGWSGFAAEKDKNVFTKVSLLSAKKITGEVATGKAHALSAVSLSMGLSEEFFQFFFEM